MTSGSETRRIARMCSAALLLWCVTTRPVFGVESGITLDVRIGADHVLVGEPVALFASVEWTLPREGTCLALTTGFVTDTVIAPNGAALKRHPDARGLLHTSSKPPWDEGIHLLMAEEPRWDFVHALTSGYQFSTPGRYELTLSLAGGAASTEDLVAIRDVADRSDGCAGRVVEPLSSLSLSWEGSVVVECPTRQVDRDAYAFLAGGSCPGSRLPLFSVVTDADLAAQLIERFPTATYAGYVIGRWKEVQYGLGPIVGNRRPSLIQRLGSGEFLRQVPKLSIVVTKPDGAAAPKTEVVDTRTRIEQHRALLEEFVAENPAFQERDGLEMRLGYDALALGDRAAARDHWEWVAEHSPRPERVAASSRALGELDDYARLRITAAMQSTDLSVGGPIRASVEVMGEDLATAPAAAGLDHDEPLVQWSVTRPTEGALLLGEPVVLVVSATWVNPEEGVTLASSPSLLSVEVHRSDGTLAQLSGCGEIELTLKSNELMPTIAWSAAEPTWTHEVDVSGEYDVYRPDTYSISVSWSGADEDAEKMRAWIGRHALHGDSTDWRLFQKLMRDPDADVVPFIGAPFTRDLSVAVVCPTREDDRQVFRMLAGGECPSHTMSTRSLFQLHENWQTVLREHPSSRYTGYALSTGLLAPQYTQGMPGLRSATEVVASLANGGYFSSHPTVSVKTGSDSTDVDSYEAARAHATMVSEYLAANPDFQYRDRLEFSLAYDMLALGEAAKAADRWGWVVTNSKRADLCASARANLDVLRSLMAGAAP